MNTQHPSTFFILELTNGDLYFMGKFKDLTGQKFGKLTVIKRVEDYVQHNDRHRIMWECKCECGNVIVVRGDDLKSGHTKSCGCLKLEHTKVINERHGLYKTRIYTIWKNIKQRCFNKKNRDYKNYGLRNILMCDEWTDKENGFMNFYNWAIQNGYSDDLSIDRIDVNGNYSPFNCRWTTDIEQANNKRNNHYVTYKNKTQSLSRWCKELNLRYDTIKNRIYKGWTPEEAFEKPIKTKH